MSRIARRLSLALVAAAAVIPAASANAGVLTASAGDCASSAAAQVFLPWSDISNYVPAPGSGAESTDGFSSLTGGAGIAAGNEPWSVSGSGSNSLRLPAGSSATTDTMCVGINYPTLRFFAKSSGTGLLSSLVVTAQTETSLGAVVTLPVGVVTPSGSWQPTAPYVVAGSLLPLLPGDMTPIRFTFTPAGPGTWSVDDVYVDPYRTN